MFFFSFLKETSTHFSHSQARSPNICEKRLPASSYVFVRPSECNNCIATGQTFVKFEVWGFLVNFVCVVVLPELGKT